MQENIGNLYIVATPIGNLEDITIRALRILGEVDFVFAEDTRTTGLLLSKYKIDKKIISYNSLNQDKKNSEILMYMLEGKSVALVTDAGTPGISDPGYSAVYYIRKYLQENFPDDLSIQNRIFAIPGPSALTSFLSVVGAGTHAFTFYGFLPHKNGRQKAIKKMLYNENSSIVYESTHRIKKFLEEIILMQEKMSKEDEDYIERKIVVGKEITKIHENYFFGTAGQILDIFTSDPQKLRGEFVVMIV